MIGIVAGGSGPGRSRGRGVPPDRRSSLSGPRLRRTSGAWPVAIRPRTCWADTGRAGSAPRSPVTPATSSATQPRTPPRSSTRANRMFHVRHWIVGSAGLWPPRVCPACHPAAAELEDRGAETAPLCRSHTLERHNLDVSTAHAYAGHLTPARCPAQYTSQVDDRLRFHQHRRRPDGLDRNARLVRRMGAAPHPGVSGGRHRTRGEASPLHLTRGRPRRNQANRPRRPSFRGRPPIAPPAPRGPSSQS